MVTTTYNSRTMTSPSYSSRPKNHRTSTNNNVSIFSPAATAGCATPCSGDSAEALLEAVLRSRASSAGINLYARLATPVVTKLIAARVGSNVSVTTTHMAVVKPDWTMMAANRAVLPSFCDISQDWNLISGTGTNGVTYTKDLDPVATPARSSASQPVLGYMFRIQFTTADELTRAVVRINGERVAFVSAVSDHEHQAFFYVPAINTSTISEADGTAFYSNSPVADDYGSVVITIEKSGTAASSSGGWSVETRPLFLTSAIV